MTSALCLFLFLCFFWPANPNHWASSFFTSASFAPNNWKESLSWNSTTIKTIVKYWTLFVRTKQSRTIDRLSIENYHLYMSLKGNYNCLNNPVSFITFLWLFFPNNRLEKSKPLFCMCITFPMKWFLREVRDKGASSTNDYTDFSYRDEKIKCTAAGHIPFLCDHCEKSCF